MIVRPIEEQIRYVIDHMPVVERQAIDCVMFGGFDADKLVKMLATWNMLWCCINVATNNPAVIGGISFKTSAVAEAMMFGTREFGQVVTEVETASNLAMQAILEGHVRRIEVRSIATHKIAHRWYRKLGLKFEAALPQYGVNGETFFLFSRLREA